MPTYNFCCEKCLAKFDIYCLINEYDLTFKKLSCPECASKRIYRDYESEDIRGTVKEIKTIGQLADYNTKKMGSKLQEEAEKNKKPEQKQWYQSTKYGDATRKQINSMTPEQKKKYIIEGKK